MKYKNHNVPDNEIDKLMDALDISMAEACEMWLSDHDVIENETVKELTEKAQKNRITSTIHNARGTNTKKDTKNRKRKENPLKKEIIQAIWSGISEKYYNNGTISIRNDEKYIDFTIGNKEFTVNLVEHRPKK